MEPNTATDQGRRPLSRAIDGRLIGGVASGIADYFDVDVVIVRVLFAALALFGGIGIPLYVAAWLLVPEEGSDESIAEELLGGTRRACGSCPKVPSGERRDNVTAS